MLNQLTEVDLITVGGGTPATVYGGIHSDLSLSFAWGRTAYADTPAAALAAAVLQPEPRIVHPF